MSFRMDQFHNMVKMNTPMMNPMMTNNCCHGNDVPVGLEIANAFLSIGGQVAMMAMQAKVQGQNQTASNNNAAINKAMEGAQDALVQLPKNSAEYAKLQDQIDDLQAQIDAAENIGEAREAKKNHEETFSEAIINGGTSLKTVTSNITQSQQDIGSLNTILGNLNKLQKSMEFNQSIVETFNNAMC